MIAGGTGDFTAGTSGFVTTLPEGLDATPDTVTIARLDDQVDAILTKRASNCKSDCLKILAGEDGFNVCYVL
ncbi:MAG TPA: hypothetical protein DEP84_26155 [Chloroflexi bacterium]|nr:hypothetical protein [Chloroflexota bacterium]